MHITPGPVTLLLRTTVPQSIAASSHHHYVLSHRPQWVGSLELPGSGLSCAVTRWWPGFHQLRTIHAPRAHIHGRHCVTVGPPTGVSTQLASVLVFCLNTQEPQPQKTPPLRWIPQALCVSLIQIGRGQGSLGHVRSWLFYTLLSCSYFKSH